MIAASAQLLQLLQTLLLLMLANVDALYAAIPVEVLDAEDMAIYWRDYFRAQLHLKC
jgi:hypothetical protein